MRNLGLKSQNKERLFVFNTWTSKGKEINDNLICLSEFSRGSKIPLKICQSSKMFLLLKFRHKKRYRNVTTPIPIY